MAGMEELIMHGLPIIHVLWFVPCEKMISKYAFACLSFDDMPRCAIVIFATIFQTQRSHKLRVRLFV